MKTTQSKDAPTEDLRQRAIQSGVHEVLPTGKSSKVERDTSFEYLDEISFHSLRKFVKIS